MILLCCSSFGQHSNGTTQPLYNGRAREGLPVTSALVLLGAVTFTLMAAYQWAGRLGLWNAGPDGQVRALSTALAITLLADFGFSVSNIELGRVSGASDCWRGGRVCDPRLALCLWIVSGHLDFPVPAPSPGTCARGFLCLSVYQRVRTGGRAALMRNNIWIVVIVLIALWAVTWLVRHQQDTNRICADDPSASVCGR